MGSKTMVVAMAAICMAGCSSGPIPIDDLSPDMARALIAQRWSHDELNHFTVTFHSDTLIACGLENGLWKQVEIPHDGFTISTYQLTEAGRKALFAINLKDTGRYHEVILQGPYTVDVMGLAGSGPDTRQVAVRWDLDWKQAPAALKACLPRFELTGKQIAQFKLVGRDWRFVSFQTPGDGNATTQASAETK